MKKSYTLVNASDLLFQEVFAATEKKRFSANAELLEQKLLSDCVELNKYAALLSIQVDPATRTAALGTVCEVEYLLVFLSQKIKKSFKPKQVKRSLKFITAIKTAITQMTPVYVAPVSEVVPAPVDESKTITTSAKTEDADELAELIMEKGIPHDEAVDIAEQVAPYLRQKDVNKVVYIDERNGSTPAGGDDDGFYEVYKD